MSKVQLSGLDVVVKNFGKTIKVHKDDNNTEFHISGNIKIEIVNANGEIDNGISCDNLICGLIVCSNYYQFDLMNVEDVKNYKCKLEKLIKKGSAINISKFSENMLKLTIFNNGKERYNYYAPRVIETIKMSEEHSPDLNNL